MTQMYNKSVAMQHSKQKNDKIVHKQHFC